MISASHNPFQDNGFKLFGKNGEKVSQEIELALEDRLIAQQKGRDPTKEFEGYC